VDRTYTEERHGGSSGDRAVGDVRLARQVVGRLDGRDDAVDGQKGGQVGRVRRDDDESEEPPRAADDPRRDGARVHVGALLHQRAHHEPERVRQRERVLEVDATRVDDARPPVVPLVYLKNRTSELRKIIRARHRRPWLDTLPSALRYVTYFRFADAVLP